MFKLTTDDAEGQTPEIAQTLDELAREGARPMIAAALEAEVAQYVDALRHHRDENDQALVVRNGRSHHERTVQMGDGSINGAGNFGFMLTATDGQVSSGGGVDKFRIKIWDKDNDDTVVYDNQAGESDDSYAGTELGGGSIVVHKDKM